MSSCARMRNDDIRNLIFLITLFLTVFKLIETICINI